VRLEGLVELKNPMTTPGIEPAIFRLVEEGDTKINFIAFLTSTLDRVAWLS
jgi:hypothetical protein